MKYFGKSETFTAESPQGAASSLEVRYGDLGDQYKEGRASFVIRSDGNLAIAFLDARGLKHLHACLSKMLESTALTSNPP